MTAITYRKPGRPLEILVRTANGIFLRGPIDAVHGSHERAPEKARKVRKLLRSLVARKTGKRT